MNDLVEVLRKASAGKEMTGLTMWRSGERWQANVRRGTSSWSVAFGEDPCAALVEALTGKGESRSGSTAGPALAAPEPAKPKSLFD